MLTFLTLRDFVIVSSLELDFATGFTALTGETGAGKSILIDALSLALGERGDSNMVRTGCERAEITAEFDIAKLGELQLWLREQELDGEEDVCMMRRVIDAKGRSRSFINGRSATLQQLREAGEYLLDIHGQHAHQSLLRPDAQRQLLDGYAGLQADAAQLAQLYQTWQVLQRRRLLLTENAAAVTAERELLQFQQRELQELAFDVTSWETLQNDYTRLSHAVSLQETAEFGLETLSEADASCLAQLSALSSRMREHVAHDARLGDILQLLDSAQTELQEAVYALRTYQQRLETDPQQLHEQAQRIESVIDTARKYRVAPVQLGEVLQRVTARLAELGSDGDLTLLAAQEQAAQQDYLTAARALSQQRQATAVVLSDDITATMQTLAMQGGRFQVALLPLEAGNAHGLETVELQVAANPGIPPRSLAKVASGGELSRISLAIQVATSQIASVPTLIFDEVDSGIGGRVAEIVGQRLKQLGKHYQVLCVTHLPQVAAMADQQWQVSKSVESNQTFSHITPLTAPQRVEEIARMLGGATITDTTRQHAAEMLSMAA
ncbi:MAG: DNA repair protein RecN [Gallionella sp.]|nr:DNA repair protein RecN [Gallionella sp.]MDD4958852.1 DNA repair protein RecN [Gallionella sp.]